MSVRFHISRMPWRESVEIFVGGKTQDGVPMRAMPLQFELRRPEHEGASIPPTLELRGREADEALQSLIDELWREGYRPKDIGTAGHLSATQAHLADFRAIVSKTLDIKLP